MSDEPLDALVAQRRREAERARAAGDLRAAAIAFGAAIELLPEHGAAALACELRLARADCLHGAGDYGAELGEVAALMGIAERLALPRLWATAALREATILGLRGQAPAATQIGSATLELARTLDDPALEAESLLLLSDAARRVGDRVAAATYAHAGLALAQALGERRLEARAHHLRGLTALGSGAAEVAIEHLRRSLAVATAAGDRAGEAVALSGLGQATRDLAHARAVLLQALTIVEAIGDREHEAMIADSLARVYTALGLCSQALALARRAVQLARALGTIPAIARCLATAGCALLGLGRYRRARAALDEAHSLATIGGSPRLAARALVALARVDLAEQLPEQAAARLDIAAAAFVALGSRAEQAQALALRAAADLAAGDGPAAAIHSAQAVQALATAGGQGRLSAQEIWWWRCQALIACEGTDCAAPRAALAKAWAHLADTIAGLSDLGLRRSYLGRVPTHRAILTALAHERGAPPPLPPLGEPAGHHDQLARLLCLAAQMNETREAAALGDRLLDELAELTGAERILVAFGPDPLEPEQARLHSAQGECHAEVWAAAAPLISAAVTSRRPLLRVEPPEGHGALASLGPRVTIAAPLISGARLLGALYAEVGAALGPFTPGELELVRLLAAQAASALENARLYEQIRRDKAELERLVSERTADLQAANLALERQAAAAQAARAAAEAASAAKSIFLANVSHELRTPLNAVIGFAQLLSRDPGLSEAQRELARLIDRSGAHLLDLITDVIELSKVEAGRLTITPAPFDLRGLVADVASLLRLRAEAKGLRLITAIDPDAPPFLLGDEGRLRQVLFNLVGNALKFTHAGAVDLRVVARRAGGPQPRRLPRRPGGRPHPAAPHGDRHRRGDRARRNGRDLPALRPGYGRARRGGG